MESNNKEPISGVPEMGFGLPNNLQISGDAKSGCAVNCAEVHCGSPVLPTYECSSLTCPTLSIGDVKCGNITIGSIHCSNVVPPEYKCEAIKCPQIKFPEYRCPAFSCPNLPPCPQCADTSFGIVVMIIVLVSLMAILLLIYKLKKNRNPSPQKVNSNRPVQPRDFASSMTPLMASSIANHSRAFNGTNPTQMTGQLSIHNIPERMAQFVLIDQSVDNLIPAINQT